MANKVVLGVKAVYKSYGKVEVLKDISLEIKENEIVSLMGPSGIGKSTLLRAINKLELIDDGEILLDNIEVHDNAYQKKIGLVFQNFNLFPHLSVLENCIQPAIISGMNRDEAKDKALALLTKLKIESKIYNYPNQLSGGQKQRLSIARACMLSPKLLCFDEPTSALDTKSIEDVKGIIQDLSRDMAILVVSHDEKFAEDVSSRLIRMNENGLVN
jgi:polar amino acid transport system ATP-binding protein